MRRIAVVDAFSSGSHLGQELLARGAVGIHIRSRQRQHPYYERSFRPADWDVDLGYQPEAAECARVLKSLKVDQVVAGTESGVELAEQLGCLTGTAHNVPGLGLARRDKYAMAEALAAAGVDAPRSALVASAGEAVEWFTAHGPAPVVVKPAQSAGSDRVRVCGNAAQVAAACLDVLGSRDLFGRPNTRAVLQEYLDGPQWYVNTITVGGVHTLVEAWQYEKVQHACGAPLFDYEEPVGLDALNRTGTVEYVQRALTALGVRAGAGHCELVLADRGPVLIDPAVRLGGGVLPSVSSKLTGASHAGLYADALLDPAAFLASPPSMLPWPRGVRYVSLINRKAGRIRPADDWVSRIVSLPTAVAAGGLAGPGEDWPETVDLFGSPGYVYLYDRDRAAVVADYHTIRRWELDGLYTT